MKNMHRSVLLLAALLGSATCAADEAIAHVAFNIQSQPIDKALTALGEQAGLQVLVRREDIKDERALAPAVHGDLTVRAALDQILADSGLTYEFLNDRTVRVRATDAEPPSRPLEVAPSHPRENEAVAMDGSRKSGMEAPSREDLQEVVVTAQKRSERLVDVPASLTALSAATLQTQGVINFADYMTLVPSLSDFSGGAEGHGAVILRGLNTGYFQNSNTVGYYIDDTPFSATSPLSYGNFLTLDPDLTDIDHLEVLKGPQATLYGASTLGGLIKVVTKKPQLSENTGEVHIDGTAVDGGGQGYGVSGTANLVLVPDRLAVRISGFDRDNPGYTKNVLLGRDDRGLSRKTGGRLAIRWLPTENLEVQLGAFLQHLSVDGWTNEYINIATLAPLNGPYTYSNLYEPSFRTNYEVYNAAINYTVGSIGTLTSSTSYAKYRDHEVEDGTLYYGPVYNPFSPEPIPPDAGIPANFWISLNKLSEELRFTSRRLGAWDLMAGLFYTREKIGYTNHIFNTIPPGLDPISGPGGVILAFDGPASYKEEAVFADVTYSFSDAIDITLGGRYSRNQQELTTCQTGFVVVPGCLSNGSSDDDFTYLAALRWRATQNLSSYARVATSYRPGGPQATPVSGYPASFRPDGATNYEVGLKGAWLDGKVRANLAVYDLKWKDVQMASNIAGYAFVSNGGRATVKGVELEVGFVPLKRLTMSGNVAYTHANLDAVAPEVTVITGAVAGDALPFTPRWAASVAADYELPLTAALSSSFGITYRYQGEKWSDYPGDPYNTGVVIPHYNTVDLRAGLNWNQYQLQARVTNVLNEHGRDAVVDQRFEGNPPAFATIIRPRAYTLSFGVKF